MRKYLIVISVLFYQHVVIISLIFNIEMSKDYFFNKYPHIYYKTVRYRIFPLWFMRIIYRYNRTFWKKKKNIILLLFWTKKIVIDHFLVTIEVDKVIEMTIFIRK